MKAKISLILALTLGPFCIAPALESDRQKPIEIEADSMESNGEAGTTTLTGKVQIRQGTLKITADEAVIHSNGEGGWSKSVVSGVPAYWEAEDEQKGTVQAWAEEIVYEPENDLLTMRRGARILQDGNEIAGEFLTYSLEEDLIKGGPADDAEDGRVHLILQPKQP